MILLLESTLSDEYTMGRLTVDGDLGCTVLHTIERPWIHTPEHRGGKKFESCVPGGRYRMVPHESNRFGKTWALVNPDLDVHHHDTGSGRYAILIHVGNRVADVVGCIAVDMDSAPGIVLQSKKAMTILRKLVPWEEHTLDIVRTRGQI